MDPLAWRKPKWIFHNLGNLLRPLELIPALQNGKYAQFLENACQEQKVIPAPAPQYRQPALISDFLDLAHRSSREEAALATNWIKDRPEGLKLQNLTLATKTDRSTGNVPKKLTADVHYAINKCESLGRGKQLILHGINRRLQQHFLCIWQSFEVIFTECAFPVLCVTSRHLGYDIDIFAASGESTAWVLLWKTRSRPIGVRVAAFDPLEWTMVVFWKEDSGRQLRLITPENEGGDERPALHHHQDLSSLMILMFLLILLTHLPRLLNLLDRQIHLDNHQDCPQLFHLLVGEKSDHDHDLNRRSLN